MKKITTFLCLLLPLTLLQGCLGSGGGGGAATATQSAVRLVNASYTAPYTSLDLQVAGATVASAVASATASSYAVVTAGTLSVSLQATGSSTASSSTTFGFGGGANYTLLAYNVGTQLRVAQFPDTAAAPTAGNGKLQVVNLSGAGILDIYVTPVGVDPTTAAPFWTGIAGITGYQEFAAGNYHIWVTGTNNPNDVRLDIPSVALSNQQILTLALTGATGGVLIDGLFITQSGAVTAAKNTTARVRLAANVTANGAVTATVNGVSLANSLRSPSLNAYVVIPAGALTTAIAVNGAAVTAPNLTAAAGADTTLMVSGNPAAPQFVLLNDDNARPTSNTAVKLRLVNGVNGLAGTISLSAGFSPVAQGVAFGAVSTPASLGNGAIFPLEVTPDGGGAALYTNNGGAFSFPTPSVYSLFILGDTTTPVGILRRDDPAQ